VADVRREDQLRAAVARTERELGTVTIAVANAGLCTYVPSLDRMELAQRGDVIAINLSGVAYTMRAVLPGMRARRVGNSTSIGPGTIASPKPTSICIGIRAFSSLASNVTRRVRYSWCSRISSARILSSEHEVVPVVGVAEPVRQPLHGMARQRQAEILPPRPRYGGETRTYGGRDVLGW